MARYYASAVDSTIIAYNLEFHMIGHPMHHRVYLDLNRELF